MKIVLILCSILFTFPSAADVSTFAIIGDAGVWNSHSEQVRDSIQRSKVKHLIMPGDNLYDIKQKYQDVWKHWSERGMEFSVVALGNHRRSTAEEIEYFNMPKDYYSKAIGDSLFVVLNSENDSAGREQAAYLELQLNNLKQKYAFVVFHRPPVTLTPKHRWEQRKDFHQAIRPLLTKYKETITGVIVGHDHIASLVEMSGIPLIVSGAVFESQIHRPVDFKDSDVNVKTQWLSEGGYYWARMDVESEKNQVWITFVRSDKEGGSCKVRIYPRPFLKGEDCSTVKASKDEEDGLVVSISHWFRYLFQDKI